MTGEKNRGTTHEKLWNLDDKQLKTPKHDEMVLWLLNEDNLRKLGLKLDINLKGKWYKNESNEKLRDNEVPEDIREQLSKIRMKKSIKSEVPLQGNNSFIIGYLDLQITNHIFELYRNNSKPCEKKFRKLSFTKKSEKGYYETDNASYFGNYRYDRYNFKLDEPYKPIKIVIEVKPYIDSFGAVLRQLNTYKIHRPGYDFYLFTIDERFKEAFESQGIKVLLPPKKE